MISSKRAYYSQDTAFLLSFVLENRIIFLFMLIQASNCSIYRNKDLIFKDLNWELPNQCFVEIIGHNRTGKTTLLETIYGLNTNLTGAFEVLGVRPAEIHGEEKAKWRKQLGYCFQFPVLLEEKTSRANIALAVKAFNAKTNEQIDAIIHDLAELLNIEHKLKTEVRFLSSSEKQLTSLAQALINKPALLLLDHFFDSFDEAYSIRIVETLAKWFYEHGTSIIITANEINTFLPSERTIMQCRDLWFGSFGHN